MNSMGIEIASKFVYTIDTLEAVAQIAVILTLIMLPYIGVLWIRTLRKNLR